MSLIWIGLATALGLAALAVAAFVWRRVAALEVRLNAAETRLGQIGEHFSGLTAGAVGQGRRLAQVDQNLARLRDRLEQVSTHEPGGAAFEQAIRMARKGESPEEIMSACGLSRMEADLVVTLHRDGAPE